MACADLACADDAAGNGGRVAIRTRTPGSGASTRQARGSRLRAAQQPARLPPGIASVLSVLSSSAVVLDSNDRVLRASAAARAFGLVKGDRLMVSELAALARSTRSLLSRTTADEESTDRTDAMPGGSRAGCWAARNLALRAGRVLAPGPGALALIATRPPLPALSETAPASSAQASTMTSEDSHTSWYAVGRRGRQRDRDHPVDIRRLFTAR